MTRKEGSTTPSVVSTPPSSPCRLVPMKVAIFMEMAPGVLSAMANTSRSSSCVSQARLSTTSCSIMVSMA